MDWRKLEPLQEGNVLTDHCNIGEKTWRQLTIFIAVSHSFVGSYGSCKIYKTFYCEILRVKHSYLECMKMLKS